MPDVPKHAWTHRPKAQGGTDPIAFPQLKSASMISGLRSMTLSAGSFGELTFAPLWSNDPSFGYLEVSGSAPNKRAKYIEISEEGFYLVQVQVSWTSAFTAAQSPFIEATIFAPSVPSMGYLINSITGEGWQDGGNPAYGSQLSSDDVLHSQMVQTVWFNFSKVDQGEDTIGIGVGLGISSTGGGFTKNIAGGVVVTRMGDLLTSTAIT